MSQFIFDSAASQIGTGDLDLSTGTYYAHLLTAAPLPSYTQSSSLQVSTATNYAPLPLSGLSYSGGIFTFTNPLSNRLTSTTAINGMAILRQGGASPASTDLPIVYSSTQNLAGAETTVTPNGEKVRIIFGTSGAIQVLSTTGYKSANYSGSAPDQYGLFYLLGTKYNTQTFQNPSTSSYNGVRVKTANMGFSSGGYGTATGFTDRNISGGAGYLDYTSQREYIVFDFGSSSSVDRAVKLGSILMHGYYYYGGPGACTLQVWGSNGSSSIVPLIDSTGSSTPYISNADWTQLTTYSYTSTPNTYFTLQIPVNASQYFRYIKVGNVTRPRDFDGWQEVYESEFYNTILSTQGSL